VRDRRPPGDHAPFPDLLSAAQAGGEWALAALYRRHDPPVRRYLTAKARGDAEDIASQTWLDVARNLRSFTGDEDAFRGWVFTIARRRFIDHARRRSRRPEVFTSDVDADSVESAGEDPADEVVASLAGDAAARRIADLLPAAQAEVVLLRVMGGLDVASVAAITGHRPGTVRVMQHRALRRLAEVLGDEDRDGL
jgi:RNA polymerase sigma-70 factor (ECF subfamily)